MIGRLPPIAFPISISDFIRMFQSVRAEDPRESLARLFEKELRLPKCRFISSGRAALTIILSQMRSVRPERNEVVIPAYTCPTLALSVARAGLNVKICDINIDDLGYDLGMLRNVVGNRTLAVVIPYLFGIPSDIESVLSISEECGAFVVEDIAQALGAKWRDRPLGTYGDATCFSFGRGKSVTTYEGGGFCINQLKAEVQNRPSDETLEISSEGHSISRSIPILLGLISMTCLQNRFAWGIIGRLPLGFENQYHSLDFDIGLLTEWQTAFGVISFRKLNEMNTIRRRNAFALIDRLSSIDEVVIPNCSSNGYATYLRLSVILPSSQTRENLFRALMRSGIGVSRMYRNALTGYDYLSNIVPNMDCPVANRVADRIIALPTHHLVRPEDIEKVGVIFSDL